MFAILPDRICSIGLLDMDGGTTDGLGGGALLEKSLFTLTNMFATRFPQEKGSLCISFYDSSVSVKYQWMNLNSKSSYLLFSNSPVQCLLTKVVLPVPPSPTDTSLNVGIFSSAAILRAFSIVSCRSESINISLVFFLSIHSPLSLIDRQHFTIGS